MTRQLRGSVPSAAAISTRHILLCGLKHVNYHGAEASAARCGEGPWPESRGSAISMLTRYRHQSTWTTIGQSDVGCGGRVPTPVERTCNKSGRAALQLWSSPQSPLRPSRLSTSSPVATPTEQRNMVSHPLLCLSLDCPCASPKNACLRTVLYRVTTASPITVVG
jgi:hypothetical protein